jgi:hypothetical protein
MTPRERRNLDVNFERDKNRYTDTHVDGWMDEWMDGQAGMQASN